MDSCPLHNIVARQPRGLLPCHVVKASARGGQRPLSRQTGREAAGWVAGGLSRGRLLRAFVIEYDMNDYICEAEIIQKKKQIIVIE